MLYVLIDVSNGVKSVKDFETQREGLEQGNIDFSEKTPEDHCTEFYLLKSNNPDNPDAPDHVEGTVIRSWL